jgi:hypothetical protein
MADVARQPFKAAVQTQQNAEIAYISGVTRSKDSARENVQISRDLR